MKKIPDISKMLPSAAKKTIENFIFTRMCESPLNFYTDPTYGFANFLADFRKSGLDSDGYACFVQFRMDCFNAAEMRFNKAYPKAVKNGKIIRENHPLCLIEMIHNS